MAKEKVTIWKYTCERCNHEWIPRDTENEPRVCPKCKSPYWNKPRKAKLVFNKERKLANQRLA